MLDHLIAYLRATLGASRATHAPAGRRVRAPARLPRTHGRAHGPAPGLPARPARAPARRARAAAAAAAAGGERHPPRPGAPGGGRPHQRARQHPARRRRARCWCWRCRTPAWAWPQPQRRAPGSHFGLAQVRERLATLHGSDFTLELIAGSAGGTSATITFPLNTRHTMTATAPRALIAEDEPLLAAALQPRAGPGLAGAAGAWPPWATARPPCAQALALQPDVLFFDIRMPGQSGLDAAAELADAWPARARPFPALVFVTAYDQYAVQAFEAQAVDYLLKPVQRGAPAKNRGKNCSSACPASASQLRIWKQRWRNCASLLAAPGVAAAPGAAGTPLTRHPGQRGTPDPPGAGGRGAVLRGRRQIRARAHRQRTST